MKVSVKWTPLLLLLHAALPTYWVVNAGHRALGAFALDLTGHIWTVWHAVREPLTTTKLIGFPDGVDLMPIVGGWLDIFISAKLAPLIGLLPAFNATSLLYIWIAGIGGHVLARTMGASAGPAFIAGTLLQLDSFLLHHLLGGRTEQVGIGFIALAIAAGLQAWRAPTTRRGVTFGTACALVVYVSWEFTFMLTFFLIAMGLWLLWKDRREGAVRAWFIGIATSLVLAGPWAGLFLYRASQIRTINDDGFGEDLAIDASLPFLEFFSDTAVTPGLFVLMALAVTPWTHRSEDRTMWRFWCIALLTTWILALGPAPTLIGTPNTEPSAWAPFTWLQALPIGGWFHWPDRLLVFWSLAGTAAVGRALTYLAERGRPFWQWAGLGACAVVFTATDLYQEGRWPYAGFEPPRRHVAKELRQLDGPGAVLDLPVIPRDPANLRYQLLQFLHRRPIFADSYLDHLREKTAGAQVIAHPVVDWLIPKVGPPPEPPETITEEEKQVLIDLGFRFIVLHQKGLEGHRFATAREALERWFGSARFSSGDWICWDLVEPNISTTTYRPLKRDPSPDVKHPKGSKGKRKKGRKGPRGGAKGQP